jgi:hypothetical protein
MYLPAGIVVPLSHLTACSLTKGVVYFKVRVFSVYATLSCVDGKHSHLDLTHATGCKLPRLRLYILILLLQLSLHISCTKSHINFLSLHCLSKESIQV